jgi:hypothetical protein
MGLELDTKKLRPNEVSLFRRVFFARLEHGAPVEAAEKQALHACRVWERLGAFNEETRSEGAIVETPDAVAALDTLAGYIEADGGELDENPSDAFDRIANAVRGLLEGRLLLKNFARALQPSDS